MRFVSLMVLLFSASGIARELACQVYPIRQVSPAMLLDGRVNIDVKPAAGKTIATTESYAHRDLTIDGKDGVLWLRLSATYYDHHYGNPAYTNVQDRFPALDVGAFWYEKDATGPGGISSSWNKIGVRFQGTPQIDISGLTTGPAKYKVWTVGTGASLSCQVIE